jgi:hypothetical protein
MNETPRPGTGRPSEDEALHRLLDDAVSDVQPREALQTIHARTAATPLRSRRPWLVGAGAAALATAATVTAVAVMANDPATGPDDGPGFAGSPSATAPAEGPTDATTPSTGPTEPPVATEAAVPVYYVGDTSRGPRLYREFHAGTGENPLTASLRDAVAGASLDGDYTSLWPAGTTVNDATVDGIGNDGLITVDLGSAGLLHDRPGSMTAEQASISVEQLIYSAQAATQTRAPVEFRLDGERTDTVLGVPTSEPLAQGDAAQVLAQVWIIDPAEGAEVGSPFEVSGLAAAFEANVQWELMDGDRVVERGFTTAEECCTMAPYSFTVNAPPGEYTLVVHDTDPSGGEGFAPWQDSKNITVAR